MSSGRSARRSDRRQRQHPHSRSGAPQARALAVSGGRIIAVGRRGGCARVGRRPDANHRRRRPATAARVQRRTRAFHRRGGRARRRRPPFGRRRAGHGPTGRRSRQVHPSGRVDHRRLLGSRGVDRWPPANANLLDEAAPNTPVFVKRLDGHMALANSEALRRAGVHEDFAAPAGGAVVRDASGRLTGLLKDAAMDVVTRAMPPLSADGLLVRARAALRHAAELGVTSIQDMTASAEEFSVYEALLASGELTARISSMQNYDGEYAVDSRKSDWLRAAGGSSFRTARWDRARRLSSNPTAMMPATPACSCTTLTSSSASSWTRTRTASSPSCTRSATGPTRSSSIFSSGCMRGVAGARLAATIEHAQAVRRDDRARFARLGVVVSLQPSHCIDDMRWAEARIGRDAVRNGLQRPLVC